MNSSLNGFVPLLALLASACTALAQQAPSAGYVFPAGGKAGSTVEVKLGGQDWTPDVQFFLHLNDKERDRFYPSIDWSSKNADKPFQVRDRAGLQVVGAPSAVLMHEPPYWFGIKSYANDAPLMREVSARFVLPADLPTGPIRWRVANANGASNCGVFIVSHGNEIIENENRTQPQNVPNLPVTISGRLQRIEEVDTYRITAERSGPITCDLMARRLGSDFHGVLEVRDADQRVIAEAVDTEGVDPALTFIAEKGKTYVISVRDLDHRGYRSMTYRLALTPGPRVLAALPAAGKRGETRSVEFVGTGVATGQPKLENVTRTVTFPAANDIGKYSYRLETAFGTAPEFPLLLSDVPEFVESEMKAQRLAIPSAVTARLPGASNRYSFAGTKGDMLNIVADARKLGSPLDLALSVVGPDGKELASADDRPGTTDPRLSVTLPADGVYQINVTDMSGATSTPSAIYRLAIERAPPDFHLSMPALLNVPIGGDGKLTINVAREGGFKEPIALTVAGLPAGVSIGGELIIPAAANTLVLPLTCTKNAPASAALVQITGSAKLGPRTLLRTAYAPATGNLVKRDPDANMLPSMLIATTIKPPFKVICVEADGGRRVHRGATHLAPIAIERSDGFAGEIVLDMAATQSRHRQGIVGPALKVAPNVKKIDYPVFLPECLETSRTSRMALVGIAQVQDAKGTPRYVLAPMEGQITMSIEGALLKVSHVGDEISARPGDVLTVPLRLARSAKLNEPVRLELIVPSELNGLIHAEPIMIGAKQEAITWKLTTKADARLVGIQSLTARATSLRDNHPVVSEAVIEVEFLGQGERNR
jgi:hypothetical protein